MTILINWLLSAIVIFVTAYILPGVQLSGFVSAFVVAVVLGVINVLVKPVIILLTLPLTVVTLGLFAFVINALMILLASAVVPGFSVDSFWWALLFSIILSFINYFVAKSNHG